MLNRSGIQVPEIKINQKLKNIFTRGMLFIIVVVLGVIILVKSLFFKSEQIITQVKFSEGTSMTYQNPYLFGFIADEVKGKNYYLLNSDKDSLIYKIRNGFSVESPSGEKIKFKFPFVYKIEFQLESPTEIIGTGDISTIIGIHFPNIPILTGDNTQTQPQLITTLFPLKNSKKTTGGGTLGINVVYYEPTILIKLNDKKFAVWDENTFVELKDTDLLSKTKIDPDSEDDTLNNLKEIVTIETPQYLTGTSELNGFFFEISLSEAIEIASLAQEEFGYNMLRLVYLAGSTRFAIFTSDQKVLYFNFPDGGTIKDQWNSQIAKYNILKEKYDKFNNVRTIDLGSLENNKAIVKNY